MTAAQRALFSAASLLVLSTCSSTPSPPPPVPPFVVDKHIFRPERIWYVSATVTDAPFATNAVTWLGASDPMEKIRWSIQEKYLIAYRSYSYLWGQGDTAPLNDHTDPVLAFAITEHVDLFQGQVVSSPRKSWADKAYMVVDWSQNLVQKVSDDGTYKQVAYAVSDPHDPDAPKLSDDYIEVTAKYSLAEPKAADPWTSQSVPLCSSGDGDFMLCEPGQFTIKRSFFPDVNDDYQPTELSQQDWARFAMFRKSFLYVDPRFGTLEAGRRFFVDAYNLWKRSLDAQGNPIPYRQREVAPVVWYLSPGFPAWLVPIAQQAIDDWNEPLRDAINGRRYWECRDIGGDDATCQREKKPDLRVVKLCPHNPVQAGDDPDCGPAGRSVGLGDLRYNALIWLESLVATNSAAVGWFNVDHETGRIVSSQAYFDATMITTNAYNIARSIRVFNGDLSLADYCDGDDTAAMINGLFASSPFGPYPVSTLRSALQASFPDGTWVTPALPQPAPLSVDQLHARLAPLNTHRLGDPSLPAMDRSSPLALQQSLHQRAELLSESPSPTAMEARASQLWNTAFEDELIDSESLARAGIDPASAPSQDQLRAAASPLRPHAPAVLNDSPVSYEPLHTAAYDPTYLNAAAKYKGWTLEAVVQDLLAGTMRGLVDHELGHCFGIRHNWSGSFDAFNYPARYWQIRNDGDMGPRWRDPLTRAEIDQGIYEVSYSSVMDYFAGAFERSQGLGHYDKAVIKFTYGGLVEVLDDPKAVANASLLNQMQLWHNSHFANGVFDDGTKLRGIHYTEYPALFGDLERRSDYPAKRLVDSNGVGIPLMTPDGRPAVPYRTCSDNESSAYATCYPEDRGADPYEIGIDRIQRYYSFFAETHYRQNRLGQSAFDYGAYYTNFFRQMTATYVLNLAAASTPSQLVDDDGWATSTLAMADGLDFLAAILTLPEPGDYSVRPLPGDSEPHYQWNSYSGTSGFNVPLGQGFFFQTQADPPSSGRNYLERIRLWGAALDKKTALDALTFSYAAAPNSDTAPDSRDWIASYYRAYPQAVTELLAAALSEDRRALGPYVAPATGQLVRRHWATGDTAWDPPPGSVLDPQVANTTRNYARTLALTRLGAGQTSAYADSFRITVDGAADDFTTTLPTVSYSDPSSGRTFRAISQPLAGAQTGIGARMLLHASTLLAASNDSTASAADRAAAAQRLAAFTQEIEKARQLSMIFDSGR